MSGPRLYAVCAVKLMLFPCVKENGDSTAATVCIPLHKRRQFNLFNSATRKVDLFPIRMMPKHRKFQVDKKNKCMFMI